MYSLIREMCDPFRRGKFEKYLQRTSFESETSAKPLIETPTESRKGLFISVSHLYICYDS